MIIISPVCSGKSWKAEQSKGALTDGDVLLKAQGIAAIPSGPWFEDNSDLGRMLQHAKIATLVAYAKRHPDKHVMIDADPDILIPTAQKAGVKIGAWIPGIKAHTARVAQRNKGQEGKKPVASPIMIEARSRLTSAAARYKIPLSPSLEALVTGKKEAHDGAKKKGPIVGRLARPHIALTAKTIR